MLHSSFIVVKMILVIENFATHSVDSQLILHTICKAFHFIDRLKLSGILALIIFQLYFVEFYVTFLNADSFCDDVLDCGFINEGDTLP